MAGLLELAELAKRGVAAETVLKLYGPLLERRKVSWLSRMSKAEKLEDFLALKEEAKLLLTLISELNSAVQDGENAKPFVK